MNKHRYIKFFLLLGLPACLVASPKPGAIFCGPYTKCKPITLDGASNVTINGLEISSFGAVCINLINCSNIKILRCKLGPSPDCGIEISNCTNVTIADCRISNVSTGVYAIGSRGINVTHIEVKNVRGPFPRGQMVQFDNVTGKGNRVNDNICENIVGESHPEDIINMYETKGTPEDPVQITGNWIRGGGPSKTGGGIMAGDSGGSYMIIKDNILVNPGQYGIAVAGGTHIKILDNKLYSKQMPFTNTGLYIWNQFANRACAEDTISGNVINWTDSTGTANLLWNGGNCGKVDGWQTNVFDSSLTFGILPETIVTGCPEIKSAAKLTTPTATGKTPRH